jgi:hypothetical protein
LEEHHQMTLFAHKSQNNKVSDAHFERAADEISSNLQQKVQWVQDDHTSHDSAHSMMLKEEEFFSDFVVIFLGANSIR